VSNVKERWEGRGEEWRWDGQIKEMGKHHGRKEVKR
jgi:hypothetical protein